MQSTSKHLLAVLRHLSSKRSESGGLCVGVCMCVHASVFVLCNNFRFGLAYADYKCAVMLDGLFEQGRKAMARWVTLLYIRSMLCVY